MRHRKLVLRTLPELGLGLVASGAVLATDECSLGLKAMGRGCLVKAAIAKLKEQAEGEHGNGCQRDHDQALAQRECSSARDVGQGRRGFRQRRRLDGSVLPRKLASIARQRRPLAAGSPMSNPMIAELHKPYG